MNEVVERTGTQHLALPQKKSNSNSMIPLHAPPPLGLRAVALWLEGEICSSSYWDLPGKISQT